MDLKMLWDNFSAIAEAENGIQRLRELILYLAFEGKLTQPSNQNQNSDLPVNWEWKSLSKVTTFVNGFAFKSREFLDAGVGVVRIGDLANGIIFKSNIAIPNEL